MIKKEKKDNNKKYIYKIKQKMLEVQERRDRKIREEEVYRDSAKVVK